MNDKSKAYVKNKKLRDKRKSLGITQDEIAEALGITRSAYQHLESKGNPSADILFRIARYFDCEMQDLIETFAEGHRLCEPRVSFERIILDENEKRILEIFRTLSPEQKARVLGYIAGIASNL